MNVRIHADEDLDADIVLGLRSCEPAIEILDVKGPDCAEPRIQTVFDTTILVRANGHSHGLARESLFGAVDSEHTLLRTSRDDNQPAHKR